MLGRRGATQIALGTLLVLAIASACSSDEAEALKRAKLSEGCTINSDCQSPLVCAFGRCHTECQDQRDCKSEELCVPTEFPFRVCLFPDERDCVSQTDCPPGLVCWDDGTCRLECITDNDCIFDQKCSDGACAVPAELVDGGLPIQNDSSVGNSCTYNSDCPAPLVCLSGHCLAECKASVDCAPGYSCKDGVCLPPAGADGGTETGTDAGADTGSDAAGDGGPSNDGGVPPCQNGTQDLGETGVDCGGNCGACTGAPCTKPSDCASSVCQQQSCQGPSCTDGLQNGNESDIDCGGGCPKCPSQKGCWVTGDCVTGSCVLGTCTAPACSDLLKNNAETDIDCGGPDCSSCANGKACDTNTDCQSTNCAAKKCVQPGPTTWLDVFSPPGYLYAPAHLSADSAGNVVAAVGFTGSVDFGNGPLVPNGSLDVALVKRKPSSAPLWSRVVGAAIADSAVGLALDSQDNVLLVAKSGNGGLFGGPAVVCNPSSGPAFVIAKYTSAGSYVFSKCVTGPASVLEAGGLGVDSSGDLIVAGQFQGTVDFGGQILSSISQSGFVAKYSGQSGALAWAKNIVSSTPGTFVYGVVSAGTDSYIVGRYYGTLTFGTIVLTSVNVQYWDAFVVKLGPTGDAIWAKTFGTGVEDRALAVAASGTSILVAGVFGAQIDFGGTLVSNQGGRDVFLLRLKQSDGGVEWAKGFGSTQDDEPVSVAVATNGEVGIGGWVQGPANFGGGAQPYVGNHDGFFARFSATGNHIASKSWGTLAPDEAFAVGYAGTSFTLLGSFGSNGLVDLGTGTLPTSGGGFFALFP